MRIKQGLKGFQLAERMQVSAARVSVLEKDETRGAVTLKIMQKAAKAMGCRFQYQIVPVNVNDTVTNTGNFGAIKHIKSSSKKPRYRVVVK